MNRLANYKDDEILYVLTIEDVETVITEEGVNRADLPPDYLHRHGRFHQRHVDLGACTRHRHRVRIFAGDRNRLGYGAHLQDDLELNRRSA